MNVQKLSNSELIEALNAIEMTPAVKVLITEAQLRLAQLASRDRMIMHIVPEMFLCSFVETVTPMTKVSFGELFEIMELAMAEADKSLAAGNLENMLKRTALVEKVRIEGKEAARKEKMPDFIEELLAALGKKPGSMH
jgi:hypothetical protein